MRRRLLLVPALALSLWASTNAPAAAIPECSCCYCHETGAPACWNPLLQAIDSCVNYYFPLCWNTWEPGDPC
jgi:hypothetical protein